MRGVDIKSVGCARAFAWAVALTALPVHAVEDGLPDYSYPVLLLVMLEVFWPVLVAAVAVCLMVWGLWKVLRRRKDRRSHERERGVRRYERPSR